MRSVLQPNHVSGAGSAVFGPSVVHGTPLIQGLNVVLLCLTSVEGEYVLIVSCAIDSYISMLYVLFLPRQRGEEDVPKTGAVYSNYGEKRRILYIFYGMTSSLELLNCLFLTSILRSAGFTRNTYLMRPRFKLLVCSQKERAVSLFSLLRARFHHAHLLCSVETATQE